MRPGPPDRPSLCGVVGDPRSLMLDAGSSQAHAWAFLDALSSEAAGRPTAVVYTHSHRDQSSVMYAELYVDGHGASVLSRPDIEGLIEKMRLADSAVRDGSAIADPDEDTEYFIQAFRAGRATLS